MRLIIRYTIICIVFLSGINQGHAQMFGGQIMPGKQTGLFPPGTVHCGDTTEIIDVINPQTGQVWMDRNLGASRAAQSSTDAQAYGDLYQWGRGADGHQCRNSSITSSRSSSDQPGHGDFIRSFSHDDWRSPSNNNLWQGVNGINNPCPHGYKVPSLSELNEERDSWFGNPASGPFQSPLKLPVAGYRTKSNGALLDDGSRGRYWTSTSNISNNSRAMHISFSTSGMVLTGSRDKMDGLSVRCLKESVTTGSIDNLDCGSANKLGSLVEGESAAGVTISVPYSGGNGGQYAGDTVSSTGITGLTATLSPGLLANGSDSVTYTITGTPAGNGTAFFVLYVAGESCTLNVSVEEPIPPSYPPGTVHCGDTTEIIDVINPQTGQVWMDRNLGASRAAQSNTDAQAYGDLYQWGRGSDGHQCRNSSTTTTLSSSDQPGHGDFIRSSIFPWDWRNPQNDNLWQGVNGVNNPCPTGYRLPTETELNAERTSWSSNNAAGAIASTLKLPLSGRRTSSPTRVGTYGYYWSSTFSGTNSIGLRFNNTDAVMIGSNRALGRSVRCIKNYVTTGSIDNLDCGSANKLGSLVEGESAAGVTISVPYSGGNDGQYAGDTVSSTGITGLTATLSPGLLANGSDSVTYTITGIPVGNGTAVFVLNVAGESCTLNVRVDCWSNHNTTAVVDVVNPTTGKTWMDRNLGASRAAQSSTDALSYGDLYQWGRGTDGHQCRTSPTTSTLSSTDQPGHGDFIAYSASIADGDWRSTQNDNLWQGITGVNNPCPTGYRVPTTTELEAEHLSWSSDNAAGAFSSPLKLPKAGYRIGHDGSLSNVGIGGAYWKSTVNPGFITVNFLYFQSGYVSNNVPASRLDATSIRCIKGSPPLGAVGALDCNGANTTGTLVEGIAASGVSSTLPYTGGNGGTHSGQTVTSTGVTGLTANLAAGTFANGADSLTYSISGTPSSSGTASFALNIGGQSCTLVISVSSASPSYPPGTVHCSGTPTEVVDVTNPITGETWMDRNLGASRAAQSSTDAQAYGDLYQWGRGADGHQCRNSATTTTLSSTDQPGNGDFITSSSGANWDWRSPQNTNLWQGVNGVNDPCPSGYRLPTETELNAERTSWSSNNNAAGAFASPLKLPVAGGRNHSNGSLFNVGTFGLYWSSTVSSSLSRALYFSSSFAGWDTTWRAGGFSVRCIKD